MEFQRYVVDTSFLDARFVRLVNQGSDGWAGEAISLTVDGKPIWYMMLLRFCPVLSGHTERS